MSTMTHDGVARPSSSEAAGRRLASGLVFAIVSASSFGMSGPLARGLMDTGWSAGAVVLIRVGLAALVVTPFGIHALRGRWALLRRNARLIVVYGVSAVAGAQFCYFSAVSHMQVGPALLIEYTAPATVVVWLWLRHGQRPAAVTVVGAGLAALGLVLVLDILSGADLNVVGVVWALAAMVGAASYFLISADEGNGLPPLTLAAGGLVVGTAALGLLGAVGVLPMHAAAVATTYAGRSFAWWMPLVVLGVVTAAISYTSGIAAGRRLGSRLASFVALLEVVAGVGFAWLLLHELPRTVQLLGGLLILAGVVAVKLGERASSNAQPPSVAHGSDVAG
jgi:drug/metabolite transporter (DMT)-like permease